ncbi:DUF5597 domain-containing protein [Sphingomonas sp. PL-96]|uniref:DUF5597 domain-containing protein n=1 Tax=Sphingomonas sp. PL-96 TaxID=2887201 RepID=UPI001E3D5A86|nr:DUF5597 domain-containing protein [Sphingomonas sp. PL-96]MCC2977083.1 DUF5597 domain-containing protein [Sphingomonas sp. PL-96]
MPRFVSKDGRHALTVDGKPFFILAAQLHNSSAWPATLDEAWSAAEALAPNTIEAPIYWEQFEPQPGKFDTTNIDALIAKARATGKRLALLWFGTWKNGQMHYVPGWMKADPATYPRMIDARGEPIDVLSPHAPATLAADKRAFATLLAHLKKVDGTKHTVIMVQVENEPGSIGSVRDFGPAAQAEFAGPVPEPVLARTGRNPGTWRAAFGPNADEAFAAYATARYIDAVAAAGKAVYPLPIYANMWLRYKDKKYPGIDYPSGGAVWTMLDLWRGASPSVDFIGTDIYTEDAGEYRKVLDQYARHDNPSWVSETGFNPRTAPFLYYVLARGGIGFSVFGIDNPASPEQDAAVAAHRANFAALDPIRALIGQAALDGRLFAAVEEPGRAKQQLELGNGWRANIAFGPPAWGDTPAILANSAAQSGRAMIIRLSDSSLLVTGIDARVELERVATDGRHGQLMRVEEGEYRDGEWLGKRWLNGDETDYGINFRDRSGMIRVDLGSY